MARQKKKKQTSESVSKLKKLMPRLVVLSVLVLSVIAVWQWGSTELFKVENMPINSVKIESSFKQVSAVEVRHEVKPFINNGFLDVDVQEVQQVLQAMPWIKTASVRLVWPDVLHVSLLEQEAFARWGETGLISREGDVFYPMFTSMPTDIPVLSGPLHSETLVLASYKGMDQLINKLGLKIDRLMLDDRRAWQLTLDDGATLLLGRNKNERRLEKFMRYYPKVLMSNKSAVDEIDLRYVNGFAVRWKKPGTMPDLIQDVNIS